MMNAPVRHIIKKQVVDLKVPPSADGGRLQQKVSRLIWKEVVHAMEEVLHQFDQDGSWIQIDRLVLDIGTLQADQLPADFTQKIKHELQRQLETLIRDGSSSDTNEAPTIHTRSPQAAAGAAFLYFLAHGWLPWWSPHKELATLEAIVAAALPADTALQSSILAKVQQQQHTSLRLLRQASPTLLQQLDKHQTYAMLEALITHSAALFAVTPSTIRASLHAYLVAQPLNWWVQAPSASFLQQLLIELFQILAKHQEAPKQEQITLLEAVASKPEIHQLFTAHPLWREAYTNSIIQWQESPKSTPMAGSASAETTEDSQQQELNDEQEQLTDPILAQAHSISALTESTPPAATGMGFTMPPSSLGTLNDTDEVIVESSIYTQLSGLVLLHPFLPTLFEANGWVQKGKFLSVPAQEKAAYFLGWLANGQAEQEEPHLVIPKVLCGLPMKQALPRKLAFSDQEKARGHELLQAVIGHWKALQTTTPEGLQQAFLQRAGKLQAADGGLELLIEEKTLDILLTKIPWGYSIIRLPWMTQLLFVHWI
ncbi:MAG: contractile injection system tape measure protein [Bacteroidota bacterium]